MKTLLLALVLALCSTDVHAQAIKAQDLGKLCGSNDESERAACTLIVQAYMHGFIEGVGKGVLDTYKYDPQVLALVKDAKMKDMAPRINKVVEASTCIQKVSVAEMTTTFVEFMRANPSLGSEGYRKAMTRAIVAKYCRE